MLFQLRNVYLKLQQSLVLHDDFVVMIKMVQADLNILLLAEPFASYLVLKPPFNSNEGTCTLSIYASRKEENTAF